MISIQYIGNKPNVQDDSGKYDIRFLCIFHRFEDLLYFCGFRTLFKDVAVKP